MENAKRKTIADFSELVSKTFTPTWRIDDPLEEADHIQIYCFTLVSELDESTTEHYCMAITAGLPNVIRLIGGRLLATTKALLGTQYRIISAEVVAELPYWGPKFFDCVMSKEVTELAKITSIDEKQMKNILRMISSYRRDV